MQSGPRGQANLEVIRAYRRVTYQQRYSDMRQQPQSSPSANGGLNVAQLVCVRCVREAVLKRPNNLSIAKCSHVRPLA